MTINFEKKLKEFRFKVGIELHMRITKKIGELNRVKKERPNLSEKIKNMEEEVTKLMEYAESQ